MRERAQGIHDIILFLANCSSNLTQNRWGERGFKKKENPELTPLQDQIDMSNKELQLKFIVNKEDNRRMILARYNSYKKSTSSKKILRKKKKNPPEHKGSANAIGIA
jgi:hypothetical protein